MWVHAATMSMSCRHSAGLRFSLDAGVPWDSYAYWHGSPPGAATDSRWHMTLGLMTRRMWQLASGCACCALICTCISTLPC